MVKTEDLRRELRERGSAVILDGRGLRRIRRETEIPLRYLSDRGDDPETKGRKGAGEAGREVLGVHLRFPPGTPARAPPKLEEV